jgi:tetratricopeptide (TPR) repeat protein
MIKKLSIYLVAAATMFATACDRRLDLQDPQAIDASIAFSTDDRVKKVLVGNYASMGAAAMFGGDALWMSELLASDAELNWVGTFPDPRMIWGKSIQTNNSYVFGTYAGAYRVIFNSNNILANLGVVKAADKGKVEGEAKFLRGMAYFELVKYFGEKPYVAGGVTTLRGVPLITVAGPSVPQSPEYNLPRSSVDSVYQQVIKDLTDASTLLPNTNGVFANKPAAYMALARVYLQQGKYAEALAASNSAITIGTAAGFKLASTFDGAFNNYPNSVEDVFTMQNNVVAGTNSCFTFFSTATFGARDGDIEVTQKHMDKYEAGDARKALFFFEAGSYRAGKWRDNYKNVKVFRLAEAYITRAECNARLGTSTGATVAADVKLIRDRAGLSVIAAPTLAQVLNERELELAFEGQGIWDAKRMKMSVDGLAWDDPKLTFPIPLRERNINPSLQQNPGYN